MTLPPPLRPFALMPMKPEINPELTTVAALRAKIPIPFGPVPVALMIPEAELFAVTLVAEIAILFARQWI